MIKRDVIISVFASSSQAPTKQWAEKYFTSPPLIINLSDPKIFRSTAQKWLATEDLFSAAVNNPEIEIGRRGLVTFSAGWGFADELLANPREREKLDAYLLVDGCHTRQLNHWVDFAEKAANGEKLFLMAHTEIWQKTISTQESNGIIFEEACQRNEANQSAALLETILPDYLIKPTIDRPITISLPKTADLPAVSKTWAADSLVSAKSRNNLIKLHYSGNDRPDHVYLAWQVQERMWRFFGEMWS